MLKLACEPGDNLELLTQIIIIILYVVHYQLVVFHAGVCISEGTVRRGGGSLWLQ